MSFTSIESNAERIALNVADVAEERPEVSLAEPMGDVNAGIASLPDDNLSVVAGCKLLAESWLLL